MGIGPASTILMKLPRRSSIGEYSMEGFFPSCTLVSFVVSALSRLTIKDTEVHEGTRYSSL
jgi:hypothetical protein